MYLTPVQKTERVLLLDVLRGFAILGIFIANLNSFTLYWTMNEAEKITVMGASWDPATRFIHDLLIEGKFYSLFSMLFGIGFAIFLRKQGTKAAVLRLFIRRLFVLLIIGIFHLLFWSGDIVAFYAIVGFVLILFRNLSNRTLLIIAGCFIAAPVALYALKMNFPAADLSAHLYDAGDNYGKKIGITSLKQLRQSWLEDDFLQFVRINIAGMYYRYGDLLFQDRFFKVLGMFLIGLVIGRTQLYNRIKENRKLLWIIAIAGIVIGLPANYWMITLEDKGDTYPYSMFGLKMSIAYALGVATLALGYAALITLWFHGSGRRILSLLAPAGKMALTNYLLHTLVGIVTFTGLGFAYPTIGPFAWTLFAIAIFMLQIFISYLWLRYFNYGPVEWLWRSATYGKWQKMRKTQDHRP